MAAGQMDVCDGKILTATPRIREFLVVRHRSKNIWLWWNWRCVITRGEPSAVLDIICRSALSAWHAINKHTRHSHNVLRFDQWSYNFRFHGCHKKCTYFRSAQRVPLHRAIAKGRSVCLSVCPSVTLVIHAQMVKISKYISHHTTKRCF